MTLLWIAFALVAAIALAATAQQLRYLNARRNRVADRQKLFHPPSAFHVATLVALGPDQELLPCMRRFVDGIEREGASVVYAGKIAVNAMASSQIEPADWDAFVLAQYPSREAYDRSAASPGHQELRSGFASSYALGMRRSPLGNLAIPVALLVMRLRDIATRKPARYPFRRAPLDAVPPEANARRERLLEGLLANRRYGSQACVVLNFIKHGSAAERAADAGYGRAMLSLMAEMGNGPTHLGRAVTLEGDAEFDRVAIVYYPGVDYFAEMVQSEFFTGIVGGKQLGDTLSSPSVPLLPHL